MSSKEDSPIARVKASFQVLSTSASELNAISDGFGKVAARIDSSFQKLNIGIEGWVKFYQVSSEDGRYWYNSVGYAKVNGKWGLAINTASGHDEADQHSDYEEWLFSDAPRALRINAVDKIPELFDKLSSEVAATTKAVDQKLHMLEEFAQAISPDPENPPVENSLKRLALGPR